MTLHQLDELCDELLGTDCERSAILSAMSDSELQSAYVDVFHQYGVELVIGAEESAWISELLVINTNQGPIFGCSVAFKAILLELSRRKVYPPDLVIGCPLQVCREEERRDAEE
jgi:hypothetical protein